MTLRLPLTLACALVLAGCANNPFGKNGDDVGGTGAGIDGGSPVLEPAPIVPPTPTVVPGSADDPTSIAHFQERVGDRVLFAVDTSTLTDEGRRVLDGQAAFLARNGEYTALIEGHADEQGTREYNLALGARRAASVQQYLLSKGIASSRLRTVSLGKERPIEICSTEACYAKNRRAVTILASGVGGV